LGVEAHEPDFEKACHAEETAGRGLEGLREGYSLVAEWGLGGIGVGSLRVFVA